MMSLVASSRSHLAYVGGCSSSHTSLAAKAGNPLVNGLFKYEKVDESITNDSWSYLHHILVKIMWQCVKTLYPGEHQNSL